MKPVFIIDIKSSGSYFMTSRALVHYPPEVPSFYRGHKVLTLGLYFYINLNHITLFIRSLTIYESRPKKKKLQSIICTLC